MVVLVGGIVVSVLLAGYIRTELTRNAEANFTKRASDAAAALTGYLKRNGDLLASTGALVANQVSVFQDYSAARQGYLGYLNDLDLPGRYPGVYGVGFMARVPADQAPALDAAMRSAGEPGFLSAPGSRAYYCPIQFFQWPGGTGPPSQYVSVGMDYCATPLISPQLNESAASGRQIVIPRAVFSPGAEHRYDFALVFPVYRSGAPVATQADREAALYGWVLDVVQGTGVVSQVLSHDRSDLGVQVYAGSTPSSANMVLVSPAAGVPRGSPLRTFQVSADTPWTLVISDLSPGAGGAAIAEPLAILLGGIALSLAVFGIIMVLLSAETRARRLADEATASLSNSEQRFRSLAESSPTGVMYTDAEGRCLYGNPRLEEMSGRPVSELHGYGWQSVIHPEERDEVVRTLLEAAGRQRELETSMRIMTAQGETRWIRMHAAVADEKEGVINTYVVSLEDVTEEVLASQRLAHQALHDQLTGLPNRALFLDRLSQSLAAMERRQKSLAVLFLDLDRFKLVNDSLGHDAGDQLLIDAGQRFANVLRSGETVARMGGDEFTILIEDVSGVSDAVRVANRISTELEEAFRVGAEEVYISASIGIVIVKEPSTSPEGVLRDADAAMYRAKEEGRARYKVFSEELRADVVHRLETETSLRRALTNNELRVFYQPLVNTASTEIVGVEALVRWMHPQRGLLAPDEFIPLAEETGLIASIGDWVLREAVLQLIKWESTYPEFPMSLSVNVNISSRQLIMFDIVELTSRILRETGLDPASLVLEITESVVMGDTRTAVAVIGALKSLGVRIAIDNFGTGYSSLSYLTRLPVDVIKIDRSFVRGLGSDTGSEAVVEAVISLGRALGVKVAATGVENEQQRRFLINHGVEVAQGYMWSRPLPPEELGRWFERHERSAQTAHLKIGSDGPGR